MISVKDLYPTIGRKPSHPISHPYPCIRRPDEDDLFSAIPQYLYRAPLIFSDKLRMIGHSLIVLLTVEHFKSVFKTIIPLNAYLIAFCLL
jgi:hypothetical protein